MALGEARMKVCIVGLWHLGTVTAACLASCGHDVVGLDFDSTVIEKLQVGQPPLYEPGLEDLIKQNLRNGSLCFSTDIITALDGAEAVWVTYDTPIDEEDRADVDFVIERVVRLFPHCAEGTLILLSSQLPVGTTRNLEQMYAKAYPGKPVTFGYSPENLRLGKAIDAFTRPDRIVVGLRDESGRQRVKELLQPFTAHIEWMSVESAEMTKHALNAFLATSITFTNEVAVLCEQVGADAKEVERGLKSDARIGPRAYLSPGSAFSGGTLARDIQFLSAIGNAHHQPTYLLSAVRESNSMHRHWVQRRLQWLLRDFRGVQVAVLGLTYKTGTDTLRRSISIELCKWLVEQGALVRAHDSVVKVLPDELAQKMTLCSSPLAALEGVSALVIGTEWPEYQSLAAEKVLSAMREPLIIDPNRFLIKNLGSDPRFRYVTVGKATL